MSFAYGHIAQRLFDTPLMYDPRKAEAFLAGLGGRISGSQILIANGGQAVDHQAFANGRPTAGRIGDFMGRHRAEWQGVMLYIESNVAVIPIEGSLVHKGTFVGQSSGITSYEGIIAQVTMAARDDAVKAVVFEIDSFGGETSGAFEAAAAIAALSKIKPTIAILTDFAYSAGYLLASQCRQIVAPEFGGAGSIGIIALHADYSGFYEKEGVKITILKSGAHKADGNPLEPLPDDVAERWQAQMDEMRVRFAEVVGRGRGARFTKAKAMKTEAQSYSSKEAVELGLIDAIADPTVTFDAFVKAVNKG
jgi:signal peptide peptidase SppA